MTRKRQLAIALLLVSAIPLAARAQASLAAAPAAAAPAAPAPAQEPRIQRILVGSAIALGADAQSEPAKLNAWLTLDVAGLDRLVEKAHAAKKPLQLFLNGMPLGGVAPVFLTTNGKPTRIRFRLARTADKDAQETLSALLGKPRAQRRTVEVSLGIAGCADGCADMTDAFPIPFVVLRPSWTIAFALVGIAFAWLVLRLARTTPLLRDQGAGTPWSLGRTQMAWWSCLVVASFVFIWMVTGDYSSLSDSVLALIGISSVTGLLGAVIDDNKQTQVTQRAALEREKPRLQAAGAALAPGDPALAANTQRLQQIEAQLAQLPTRKTTQGFLTDILSDENGMSFHRLQIVIWTLVLTLIFLVRVYVRLAMPDFDTQLLALMGISNGTYLGFKLPEKQG